MFSGMDPSGPGQTLVQIICAAISSAKPGFCISAKWSEWILIPEPSSRVTSTVYQSSEEECVFRIRYSLTLTADSAFRFSL